MYNSILAFLTPHNTRGGLIAALIGTALLNSQVCATPATINLPGERAFPENITATSDGTLFVGSLGAGGIYRVKRHTSKSQYWIRPGAFGSRSIFGVLADENSNTLWACSNDLSAIGVLVAGSDSKSTLKGFDLKTGAGKVSAVLSNEHSLCNDIAVGQDGSVFVTNSAAPEILRLPPGSQRLEV